MSEELEQAVDLVLEVLKHPEASDELATAGGVDVDTLRSWSSLFLEAGTRAIDQAPGVHTRDYHRDQDQRLGALLIKAKVITATELREALEVQQQFGGLLGEILIELGHAAVPEVLAALGDQRRAVQERAWTSLCDELTPHQEFLVRRCARDSGTDLLDAGVGSGVASKADVLRHVLAAAGLD